MVEVTASRESTVGNHPVRRALPRRDRRTVGSWCFADHMGPSTYDEDDPVGIGPHPHIGLQTVTWLVAGELLHRDNLGSEQTIRPGQLNLMTAGRGVSHAEENVHTRGQLHGIQLWVAQPERTRHGDAAFEHHAELPHLELPNATATVLVGRLGEIVSAARRDTDHFGAELRLRTGTTVVPVDPSHEHALVVVEGRAEIGDVALTPGHLGYLEPGRDELPLSAAEPTRLLLLGGEPFESKITMWWNYVARDRDEIARANVDWADGHDRFGDTGSTWPRIPAPTPPWETPA
jgi:quercetin 2,3-dioxygenase